VYTPEGVEAHRIRSRDFADRPNDDDLLSAARRLGVPAIELPPAAPSAEPEEHDGALRPEAFGPYFRGVRFGTIALAGRMTTDVDRDAVVAMSEMAASFIDAWKQRRATAQQ
jgi:hypothetical protein